MPYTHFRYIAYQVPTASSDAQGNMAPALRAGVECPDADCLPIVVDPQTPADARIRLKRLAAVVAAAERELRQPGMHDDVNTLKVFIVPEFYFRPESTVPGAINTTYSYADAMAIFEQLNGMFVHAAFQHWFFVLGTVMWNWAEGQIHYRNSAVRVTGHAVESLRIIEKDIPSRLDGVPHPFAQGRRERYDPYLEQVFQDWGSRRNHAFQIGGVVCGLEVCLDHAHQPNLANGRDHRVLKTCLDDWPTHEPRTAVPALQLHLLTAGGMDIAAASVAAVPNGYILRNDGYSDTPQVELRRVLGYRRLDTGGDTVATDLGGQAHMVNFRPQRTVDINPAHCLVIDPGWAECDQQLLFFRPRPLPPVPPWPREAPLPQQAAPIGGDAAG